MFISRLLFSTAFVFVFVFSISNECTAQTSPFGPIFPGRTIELLGGMHHDLVGGDFNSDGLQDIAALNQTHIGIYLYQNDDTFDGSLFSIGSIGPIVENTGEIVAADIDADSDLDLIVGVKDASSNYYRVMLNDGNGTFSIGSNFDFNSGQVDLGVGDLNGDGYLDLALISAFSVAVSINDSMGNFSNSVVINIPGANRQIEIADLDGDSDQDIASFNGQVIRVFENNGNGQFSLGPTVGSAFGTQDFAVGDYDNDGDTDLAAASNTLLRVYENNGGGNFSTTQLAREADFTRRVQMVDLDGDNLLDMVVANALFHDCNDPPKLESSLDVKFKFGKWTICIPNVIWFWIVWSFVFGRC